MREIVVDTGGPKENARARVAAIMTKLTGG